MEHASIDRFRDLCEGEEQVELAADQPTGIIVLERSIYRGPNIYSRRPMVRIRINLGPLEARPTNTLPGFSDRLLAILPGLGRHHCSLGRVGGLVDRMAEGTWLGHV